jgi:hypothetical protein
MYINHALLENFKVENDEEEKGNDSCRESGMANVA